MTPEYCCLLAPRFSVVARQLYDWELLPASSKICSCCLLKQNLHLVASLHQLHMSRGNFLSTLTPRLQIQIEIQIQIRIDLDFPYDWIEVCQLLNGRLLCYQLAPVGIEYQLPFESDPPLTFKVYPSSQFKTNSLNRAPSPPPVRSQMTHTLEIS